MMYLKPYSGIKGFYKIFVDSIRTEIGTIHYKIKDGTLFISNLEIYEEYEKKGYGRTVIKNLKSIKNISILTGEAIDSSKRFWLKIGAIFIEDTNSFVILG
ncbi:hypothetical protein HUB98_06110 [Paenibacillus barcinonensis]|uniref:Acetyltransferase (GNAT) family protein n=1 Tax=Paenibacillus barcinonensis TaxID=198119 RepID=A0A2V4VWA0_PAEBA|nr:hypothetical protein [Paenibacillus barcinonensis]PYE51586.1 hypothetical protein DFQ00_102381 [Paenibacillus barcinonensis]QKS55954.1 hypothetical protein HUB98_06110 [Paenibacillus barcinonensis]